jgi:hypothetical protein
MISGGRRFALGWMTTAVLALAAVSQQQPEGLKEEKLFQNEFVSAERITLEKNHHFGFDPESMSAPLLSVELIPRQGEGAQQWGFARARFYSKEAGVRVGDARESSLCLILLWLGTPVERSRFGDDATILDPKHNEVLFENKRVRVVRIHFPPGESGPIVDKRARVIIMLTDSHATVTLPDGHSEVRDGKAGTVSFSKGGRQATNNVGTTELENIVVELKGK